MTEIVNLRRARKRKDRLERERDAATNRASFGRTKAGRERDRKQTELDAAKLAGHLLDDTKGNEP